MHVHSLEPRPLPPQRSPLRAGEAIHVHPVRAAEGVVWIRDYVYHVHNPNRVLAT